MHSVDNIPTFYSQPLLETKVGIFSAPSCVCVCVYVCLCIYVCMCLRLVVFVCVCMYVCTSICVSFCAYVQVCSVCVCVCVCVCERIYNFISEISYPFFSRHGTNKLPRGFSNYVIFPKLQDAPTRALQPC
jgi:hypothetical protein